MVTQLEEARTRVEDVYKEQSESVDGVWQTSKLAIVPGDLLLDSVCKQYGVRFKKEQDGVRLAALMRENEIDEEIKEIIRSIGTGKTSDPLVSHLGGSH